MNICGVVVHAKPEFKDQIIADLNARPGVEVHGMNENGNMVVTVEDAHSRAAANTIASFNDIEGVYAANLVYHEIDDTQTQQEACS